MTTNIRISKLNRDKLVELKQKGNHKSIDAVIQHLLQINKKYKTGKVVRLIE